MPLAQVGGKGLFVKEIEEALLAGAADLAVHSMKDVPAELAPGLMLAAVSEREDPRDALCSRGAGGLAELPAGAHVGTSSLRRGLPAPPRAGPICAIAPLRGNVDTRLRKLDAGDYDAIVLAAAGLRRLGHADRISELLGARASACRPSARARSASRRAPTTRRRSARVRAALHHEGDARRVAAERAFLPRLGGCCQTPLAAHARADGDRLTVDGMVGRPDGSLLLRARRSGADRRRRGPRSRPAEDLLAQGAAEILAALQGP